MKVTQLTVLLETRSGRLALDRLLLRLPFFGPCLRKIAVARFCRTLSIMVRGGVPVAGAMAITADVLGNKALEKSLQKSRDMIIAGSDISTSLYPRRR